MTGNDIISREMMISLKRPLRYAEKILISTEMKAWSASGQLGIDLWKYWALKESAFKIYIKKGGERKLNPKQFIVEWMENTLYVVDLFHDERYLGKLTQNEHFVHALLVEDDASVNSSFFPLVSEGPDQRSREVRHALCHALGVQDSQITNNEFNIPILSGWDISLSHCGNWGAWSALKL